ncbi:glycine--tRNA ligase subunit beta [Cohnella sp. CIP 111063]|uniref:glycine--tRNA ligase subunit beta n=1 Tax=unclassified Cohnella TaxID=2636738 RepID=UPI000B8C0961|nr:MULTISPECIES: glycine--tRNA ligase subunit beta [unclassified Cohnella]OXS62483.1 glycine--tRNA ligase subunit beta [Cohnella sp. CIP 111063]PRX74727.1 glycyl-tRNA synthetase beta chain [Cohnella sp. SGD-V74]
MAKDLLLEIGMEEVPARFVRAAMEQLQEKTVKWLEDSRLAYGEVKAYATPRRLAVLVSGLADKQEDVSEDVKGPSRKIAYDESGAWSKPALGFARSQGVEPDSLFLREIGGVEYVFATKSSLGVETASLLPEALPALVTSLTFPKNMRWGSHELRYVRPIRWLVALHGDQVVPFEIAGVASGNETHGHRFLGHEAVIAEPSSYVEILRAEHVIVDVEERRRAILTGIESLAAERGWTIGIKEDLLEEVLFLVETPSALSGSFDPSFLDIPQEVLITSMREHQRYFPVFDGEGRLLPHFVTVRNGDRTSIDVVAKGNEKVLRARLSDAKFFYEEDKKLVIADALAKLENIVYHEELGTVADKVRRVRVVADKIAAHLRLEPSAAEDIARTADICKFDLVSQMVYEFPELQGIMGEDYARLAGERETVARAINEHYSPRNAGDKPAASIVGAIVGIADKLDTIAGCFSIGIIPTGSQDPYALRRQAAGIVNTLLAHELEITLDELFRIALDVHAQRGLKREAYDVAKDMREFFVLRVKNVLSEQAIRYDVVDAVLGAGAGDVRRTVLRASALQAATADEAKAIFRPAVEAFNRVCNLAAKADSKQVDANLFADDAESKLYEAWQQAHGQFVKATAEADLGGALSALSSLSAPVTAFFEAVMVMAEDEALRRNRLAILALVADDVKQFADFSKLAG